jgi:trans-aconitate methyltransferase
MNEQDRDLYRTRYVARLAQYGYDPRTLGWAAGKQAERFAVLTSFVPLGQIESVLDVGCGFGDLYGYLRQHDYRGTYTGIDLVPELIEEGRTRFVDADLRVADLSDMSGDKTFDLVVGSGIFNAKLRHESSLEHIRSALEKMFAVCRQVTAVDFLTSYVDFERDDLHYMPPETAFAFAKALTRRVALRHDYMPFEFALGAYRDDTLAPGARFQALQPGS